MSSESPKISQSILAYLLGKTQVILQLRYALTQTIYYCYPDLPEQDFIPKLKRHLLPRIKTVLAESSTAYSDVHADSDWESVVFKQDRMYKHKTMRINYTSYDVRRGEDVIHTGTSRCDVILINPDPSLSHHPFLYARVLGIYHVNAIYLGEGTIDYAPRQLEFLWVRWYEEDDLADDWSNQRLGRVSFPPITQEDSCGFIDPADVLRGCHMVSAFRCGKVYSDGIGISHCAQDSNDWRVYYIGRYVYISINNTVHIN